MESRDYEVIMDTLPATDSRLEVLFRQAGDGFLQVEYGRVQRAELVDSFRIGTVNERLVSRQIPGLIETVPGIRTNLLHFDPEVLDAENLIAIVKKEEDALADVEGIELESRLIHLPIAFEDSETKKAVAKYVKEVRPGAPNVINGYNLEYIALCNGVSVAEVKRMLLETEWYNSGCGFWPGGGFFWPMDPRCAIVVPKYNPPRTWTPEGTVGIGGPCVFTYTTATGGGYQLFGRTIPTFQFSQKHPLFRETPFLYRNGDRIKFHEVSEAEILRIFEHVHEKTDYRYEIEEGRIVVKDYLSFISSDAVQQGVAAFKQKQAEGSRSAPRL
ncbi:MAG TPA: carboxyltransferase domain-containing protein [Desulfobacterales bacterium]|jgi:urea carboxylase|nr:carboxyltransferase domain-containing protein [Desulfobacterales bacterium]